jgi:hypothetical protein
LLLTDSNSGLLTYRASKWRFVWKNIYAVKQHLLEKNLVQDPADENDMFYHVPLLEEGLETTWHIRQLLIRTGFAATNSRIFDQRFFRHHLARLMQRDVWENVQGK